MHILLTVLQTVKYCIFCNILQIRYYYLHLLYHILGSTDYGDMLHRQDTLRTCLNRIFLEEDVVNTNDKEEVSKIWDTFPQYFLQSSNV